MSRLYSAEISTLLAAVWTQNLTRAEQKHDVALCISRFRSGWSPKPHGNTVRIPCAPLGTELSRKTINGTEPLAAMGAIAERLGLPVAAAWAGHEINSALIPVICSYLAMTTSQ